MGSGDGTGSLRRAGGCVASTLEWVLRAGVVARERVTALDFDGRDGRDFGRAPWRADFARAGRLAV